MTFMVYINDRALQASMMLCASTQYDVFTTLDRFFLFNGNATQTQRNFGKEKLGFNLFGYVFQTLSLCIAI